MLSLLDSLHDADKNEFCMPRYIERLRKRSSKYELLIR